MITASLRASATLALFMPARPAIRVAQLLSSAQPLIGFVYLQRIRGIRLMVVSLLDAWSKAQPRPRYTINVRETAYLPIKPRDARI